MAKVTSCRAVASSLASFTGRCPLPSEAPLPESGAVGQTAPGRSGTPAGAPYRESARGAVPGASDTARSGRSALPASACLLVVLRPALAARRLRFPFLQQPAGRHPAHAVRFGFGASSSSCCCRPPADLALPLGVRGSGTRGSSGGSGRSGSAAIPPVRGPSLGGAWLKTHWSHWLRANGGGGRAGPGAAEPSAAVDEGTDAAAAVRPLAMAPGGEAARTAPPH